MKPKFFIIFLLSISINTLKPIPPRIIRLAIGRRTNIEFEYLERDSSPSISNPALQYAETEWNIL